MSESLIKTKLLHGHNHFGLGSEIWTQITKVKILLPKILIYSFAMYTSVQFIKEKNLTNIHITIKMDHSKSNCEI